MTALDPALKATGEARPVEAFANELIKSGTGADRQRRGGELSSVVASVVSETVPSAVLA